MSSKHAQLPADAHTRSTTLLSTLPRLISSCQGSNGASSAAASGCATCPSTRPKRLTQCRNGGNRRTLTRAQKSSTGGGAPSERCAAARGPRPARAAPVLALEYARLIADSERLPTVQLAQCGGRRLSTQQQRTHAVSLLVYESTIASRRRCRHTSRRRAPPAALGRPERGR